MVRRQEGVITLRIGATNPLELLRTTPISITLVLAQLLRNVLVLRNAPARQITYARGNRRPGERMGERAREHCRDLSENPRFR